MRGLVVEGRRRNFSRRARRHGEGRCLDGMMSVEATQKKKGLVEGRKREEGRREGRIFRGAGGGVGFLLLAWLRRYSVGTTTRQYPSTAG